MKYVSVTFPEHGLLLLATFPLSSYLYQISDRKESMKKTIKITGYQN